MSFNLNKTPIEIIKEGTFGGTYFRDIYSSIDGKWYRNSWKEFDFLRHTTKSSSSERIDPKLYSSNYYDANVNKHKIKCGTSLRFWENKGWIREQDLYGWFQWYCRYYLGRRSEDDKRQIARWNNNVNRFKSILVKMIKSKNTKYNNYSISPKIRQILLHWGYELVESGIT